MKIKHFFRRFFVVGTIISLTFTIILLIVLNSRFFKQKQEYEVIVTGTHEQVPCVFEIWHKDSLITTVNTCEYGKK